MKKVCNLFKRIFDDCDFMMAIGSAITLFIFTIMCGLICGNEGPLKDFKLITYWVTSGWILLCLVNAILIAREISKNK